MRARSLVFCGLAAAMVATGPVGVAPAVADVGGKVSGLAAQHDGAWAVIKGSYLKATLDGWCRAAGWDLIWDSTTDYELRASAAFHENFEQAVTHLMDSIYIDNPEISATLYRGNKVLHVMERSLTSN